MAAILTNGLWKIRNRAISLSVAMQKSQTESQHKYSEVLYKNISNNEQSS